MSCLARKRGTSHQLPRHEELCSPSYAPGLSRSSEVPLMYLPVVEVGGLGEHVRGKGRNHSGGL